MGRVEVVGMRGLEKEWDGQSKLRTTNCGTFKLCTTCTTYCGTSVVQIGDLGLKTKRRREGYRAYSELCTTNCGTFKLCTTCTTFCGTSVVQNRGSGAQNQKLPQNISKLEYFGAFWLKIQNLKNFEKKPKNHILGGQK